MIDSVFVGLFVELPLFLLHIPDPMSRNNQKSNGSEDIPEFCYLQVSIAGQDQPRPIVIQLHKQACPKTCRNFVALCSTKDNDEVRTSPKRPMATYCGSYFHRIVPNFMCQAGDFERFDGTGGYSPIYQGGRFDDENFAKQHDREGVVSMANTGKNTNKSQFFVRRKVVHSDQRNYNGVSLFQLYSRGCVLLLSCCVSPYL